MKLTLRETPYYSLAQGELTDGCKQCVEGKKLVLFITGVCPAKCFYCPISPEKKMVDVIYANERQLLGDEEEQIKQMLEEARANKAEGAGITGGDPLARLGRTCDYIKALKRTFGPEFHIHLYTTPMLLTKDALERLFAAGLDEIRFHPLEDKNKWERMLLAKSYSWKIGIEIPVIPDKLDLAQDIIRYAAEHDLVSFINLNELEVSELCASEFDKRKYHVREESGYGIDGCKEAALELMAEARKHNIPVHYCTTTLKDKVQMGNRLRRRAEEEAHAFDIIEDGLLTRGAIYISYPPLEEYERLMKTLSPAERKKELPELEKILSWLRELGMPDDAGMLDDKHLRIILNAEALRELAKELRAAFPKTKPFIITEYPTTDALIVEATPLY